MYEKSHILEVEDFVNFFLSGRHIKSNEKSKILASKSMIVSPNRSPTIFFYIKSQWVSEIDVGIESDVWNCWRRVAVAVTYLVYSVLNKSVWLFSIVVAYNSLPDQALHLCIPLQLFRP